MVIVEKCKEEMKSKGMTRKQLAEASGVPLPTINSIFNGTVQDPRYVTMTQICKAVGISIDGTVGIISPDMGQDEIERINREHAETKEQLRQSIERHNEFMEHRQEIMESKDKAISGMEKQIADLRERIKSQVFVINIFRIWIFALHIYGFSMDSMVPDAGLIRGIDWGSFRFNGLTLLVIFAAVLAVYFVIRWVAKRKWVK